MADIDQQQPFGRKAEFIQSAPVGRAAFGPRHVFGDPDDSALAPGDA